MKRHSGDLVPALECGAVQRLDVGQHLVDLEPVGGHGAGGEAVEHEGVVRVWTMGYGNFHLARVEPDELDVIVLGLGIGIGSALEHDRQTEQHEYRGCHEAHVRADTDQGDLRLGE